MLNKVCEKYNAVCNESPTGEVNVVLEMQKSGAVYGIEGNGGIINSDVHYGRDSIVGSIYFITVHHC